VTALRLPGASLFVLTQQPFLFKSGADDHEFIVQKSG